MADSLGPCLAVAHHLALRAVLVCGSVFYMAAIAKYILENRTGLPAQSGSVK